MFRRQQTQQTKPNTGIKSFSSRVERRRKAMVEEKKEEPVKPVKAIPKRTAKAEDLPVLGTDLSANNVESCDISKDTTNNAVTITITYKPLIGDYTFSLNNNTYINIPVSSENWNAINAAITGATTKKVFIKIPSYQPSTITSAKLYDNTSGLSGIRILDGSNISSNIAIEFDINYTSQEWVTIEKLYLVNLITMTKTVESKDYTYYNPPSASGTFTSEDSGSSHTLKIVGISKLAEYTSNAENHADVKNLYTTNCLYLPGAGENYNEFENNIVVKGDFEEKIYQYLPISGWKLNYHNDGSSKYFQNETDGTYSLHSIGKLPSPDGHEICIMKADGTYVDDNIPTSWDFTQYAGFSYPDPVENVSDITSKFDNFYINNVTLKPSTTNNIKTRFTQVVGTDYIGSNVTILAAPAAGEGGVTEPVDDPLVPLIKDIDATSTPGTIIFNIKPNEKGTLLVGNRSNTDEGEIIIDLSESALSDALKDWDPSATSGTTISFVQEAVILKGDFSTNAPDVRLNNDFNITKVTIKYFKKGVSGAKDTAPTITLVVGTPGEGQNKLANMTSIINDLYIVNGTVSDKTIGNALVKRLLTPLTATSGLVASTIAIKLPSSTVSDTFNVKNGDDTVKVTSTINNYHATNIILVDEKNKPLVDNATNGIAVDNNFVVCGNLPDWMINSDYLRTTGYNIGKGTGDNIWNVIATNVSTTTADAVISTINWLPVDGYGELDIGVDFTTTPATLGSATAPIVLPENSDRTKNELKLLNFNMNEIYVKQTKSTADLDLTATVNHNYEGATVYNAVEMGGVSGTASPITDLISGFELTGDILTIKIKPSDKKNILKDYRKDTSDNAADADKKEINLNITGNLNLCNDLSGKIGSTRIGSVIIEQEALILDDSSIEDIPVQEGSETTFKGVDITMNKSVEISSLKLKYLKKGTDDSFSEEELSFTTVGQVNHEIDEFYFVHGTVSNKRLLEPLSASDVFTGEKKIVLEDVLALTTEQDNEIRLLVEGTNIIENAHLTNIINGLETKGKSNVVVSGEIPKWAYDDFNSVNGIAVPAVEGDNATPAWTLSTVNDFPCSGYGALDIGIKSTPLSTIDLRVKTGEHGVDNDFEDTIPYGKEGFYVDVVTLPKGTIDQVS